MSGWAVAAAVGLAVAVAVGCSPSAVERATRPAPGTAPAPAEPERAQAAAPRETEPAQAVADPDALPGPEGVVPAALLVDAGGGDGDSWHDTDGREYRLGMINAPERDECFGSEATAERRRLTAAGFDARSYTKDRYGRAVSVVLTATGANLNVHLARRGFADDRYLEQFRHENPQLAAQLDAAFAAAKAERAGLWSACRRGDEVQGIVAAPQPARPAPAEPAPAEPAPAGPAPAAPAPAGGCHPDYVTCIPVRGDGSGHGRANDVDCGGISGGVQLRSAAVDPYRLDADGDGSGCY